MDKYFVSQDDVSRACLDLIRLGGIKPGPEVKMWGVPRGGIPAVWALASFTHSTVVENPSEAHYIIDDLWDSGATFKRYIALFPEKPFLVLFDKRMIPWKDTWLVMPWEVSDQGEDASADDIVIRLLEFIGEDPTREGLIDTPRRFLEAWKEWSKGYGQDPAKILKTFKDGAEGVNEMVIVHDIPVISKCEHHLADIIGVAQVGYIPNKKIVGLSKLARLVDCFARRLQVQERLTNQIADSIQEHLNPIGCGVIIRAEHSCMSTRGVRIHGSETTTSAMRGALLNESEARSEFITLCQRR